jgi:hypothetical protein
MKLGGDRPTLGELFASFRLTLLRANRPSVDTKWGAVGTFWRAVTVTDVTPKRFREYYAWRRRFKTPYGEPLSNGTLHKGAMLLRQVLEHTIEEGHIAQLPLRHRHGRYHDARR